MILVNNGRANAPARGQHSANPRPTNPKRDGKKTT